MVDCAEEQQTQHHLGVGHGLGPVDAKEYIYFAVFEQTAVAGQKLAGDSFENGALKRSAQSVSRAAFITRQVFDQEVVKTGENPKGALTGVAAASVRDVRLLRSRIQLPGNEEKWVRSFCILDFVLQGDYDAHATIGYGEKTKPHEEGGIKIALGEGQIKAIRAAARMELADAFGPIQPIEQIEFAPG
jgi:hypothetical protein